MAVEQEAAHIWDLSRDDDGAIIRIGFDPTRGVYGLMFSRIWFRSIGMKLAAVVTVVILFLIGTAAGFSYQAGTFLDDLDRQEQSSARIHTLQGLLRFVQNAELGLRAFVVTGDSADLAEVDDARDGIRHSVLALKAAYRPQLESAERIGLVEAGAMARLADLERIEGERREHGTQAAQRMAAGEAGKRTVHDLRATVAQMLADERTSLSHQRQTTLSRLRYAVALWLVLIAASMTAVVVSVVQVMKQVRRNAVLMLRLQHDARHDFLTGLPNRAFFQYTLSHVLAGADRENMRAAVLYMDLNGFKAINDELGHDVGDLVLIEVANRLRRTVRSADFLARLGGDEFAVLVPRYSQECELAELVGRIEDAVVQVTPAALHGRCVSISVGVASYPDQCSNAEALLEAADQAMFTRKRGTCPPSP